MIQNVEDNQYSKAATAKQDPFLIFTLHPSRIVVDSNEDGFNEANVKAICSTSQSTKTNAQGYIGEKGIGFKSVFKVASKVHIQSKPFSFAFQHKFGDSGLGMVTPYERELWYQAMNTIAPMAKNCPSTIRSLSNSTEHFFKKYLKTLYNNIIDLNKGYRFIYLFFNLNNNKKIFINFKLKT